MTSNRIREIQKASDYLTSVAKFLNPNQHLVDCPAKIHAFNLDTRGSLLEETLTDTEDTVNTSWEKLRRYNIDPYYDGVMEEEDPSGEWVKFDDLLPEDTGVCYACKRIPKEVERVMREATDEFLSEETSHEPAKHCVWVSGGLIDPAFVSCTGEGAFYLPKMKYCFNCGLLIQIKEQSND